MNRQQLRDILAYEWEGKKSYINQYDGRCDICKAEIYKDDTIYFYADRQNMCQDCYEDVDDTIQNL